MFFDIKNVPAYRIVVIACKLIEDASFSYSPEILERQYFLLIHRWKRWVDIGRIFPIFDVSRPLPSSATAFFLLPLLQQDFAIQNYERMNKSCFNWEVKPIFVAAITNRTNKSSKKPTKPYIFMFIDTSYLYSWFPGGFSVTPLETKQLANSFTLQDQEELGGNCGKKRTR